jgi:mono/diheme cytochrome c family protein
MSISKRKRAAVAAFVLPLLVGAAVLLTGQPPAAAAPEDKPPQRPLRVDPPHVSTDKTVNYDYDIVYVRAPRTVKGGDGQDRPAPVWPDAGNPEGLHAPTDLMLLHPDGSEEVLVEGGKGGVADPYVSFDAQWVYYTYHHDVGGRGGADVYKVHVKTRKTVRLTRQEWTPNTGVAEGKALPKGVYNMHPCPLPGGRVAFVSDRDGLKAPRHAQGALQLFVMDDDGANVEKIGHLKVGQALHPVVLTDGRIIFSSLEVQGKRNTGWGILGIRPDGTGWNPVVSALGFGGAAIPFHFQTQLSDGAIVVENYYVPAMGGFGVYLKMPPRAPEGTPPFAAARWHDDPKMAMMSSSFRMPFRPHGMEVLTRFTHNHDSPSLRADRKDPASPHTGWVTHPCGAPDNHLLTVWSGMMPATQGRITDDKRPVDAGIYLIKGGRSLWEPGEMLLIKNDPRYNEQWPRPLVPYKRVYGVDEPQRLPALGNDGTLSKHLPEGTPFGLVGTSSLYKRESFPQGEVPKGGVTATGSPYAAFPTREHRTNWDGQGADAGLYSNSDIHAIRILVMEPPSLPVVGRFSNLAGERLRILGEIPVRKFDGDKQPLDPDGNPDTSFLARIPADVAWTFQTIDRDGMVLNMAQTWHQLRPGEVRNNCGGCHAHSQQPTDFNKTAAAKPDYPVFDLTASTPLLTDRKHDESGKKWDVKDETGLRFARGVLNVEYHRDIKPIFERSCVACHSRKSSKPAGGLVLDDDSRGPDRPRPATYDTLVHPRDGKATRYVWPSQSRNSLLAWKLFGRRTDGFPEKTVPGAEGDLRSHLDRGGEPYSPFKGSIMPPPEAVAGTYEGPDGQKVQVAPLTDEDRRTILRWIDLGCPIDHDFDPKQPQRRGNGWMLDDQRPTLTLTYPRAGENEPLSRILVGAYDYGTGLERESFSVVADFPVDGVAAGEELAGKFRALPDHRWELRLARPITDLPRGKLVVSVKDGQGNVSRVERTFSVAGGKK